MPKTALITGITGQDGAYLAEFLLAKGYTVHGIKRRSSSFNTARVDHLYRDPHETDVRFHMHYGDLTDATNLIRIIQEVQPDEIYNLAAQSHVMVSFETPEYTANSDALGTLRILEAIRILKMEQRVRFYQASTSELFGKVRETPQTESTPFYPRSPYGVAKLYGYWITVNYREAYGMYACNGILFNHESPIRGETFVTRKITRAIARIALGLQECIYLGNLDARRDWGHARDYVQMQWLMLQQETPEDYVIATGEQHSVREFVELAAQKAGFTLRWEGSETNEIGIVDQTPTPEVSALSLPGTAIRATPGPLSPGTFLSPQSSVLSPALSPSVLSPGFPLNPGRPVVRIDPRYYRPTEVDTLLGDPSKAKTNLGWEPKVTFDQLVTEMVAADIAEAKKDQICNLAGFKTFNNQE